MKKLLTFITIFFLSVNAWAEINLNGDADYVNIGTMGSYGTGLDTNTFVFSAWIRSANTASIMSLLGTINTGNTTILQLQLNCDANTSADTLGAGKIRLFRRDEDGFNFYGGVDTNSGITDGSPHHLVVLGDNNGISMWIDGVSQTIATGTDTPGNVPDNMANFEFAMDLGARNVRGTHGQFFIGNMSDVYIWRIANNATFTQAEIDQLSKSRVKRIGLQIQPTLLLGGYWPLDDVPSGTSIASASFVDMTGLGNNGTGVDADGDSLSVGEAILSYP